MVQGTQADYEAMRGKGSEHSPAWSEQEIQTMYAFMSAINDDLSETGEMLDGQGLAEPAKVRHVNRGADGKAVITDGPVRRDQGAAGRLLGAGLREPGAGHRDRRPRRAVPPARGRPRLPGGDPAHPGRRRGHLRTVRGATETEDLLRLHAPQVLGALVRRYGHFDAAEDAVQEALLAAARQWPVGRACPTIRAAGSSRSPPGG